MLKRISRLVKRYNGPQLSLKILNFLEAIWRFTTRCAHTDELSGSLLRPVLPFGKLLFRSNAKSIENKALTQSGTTVTLMDAAEARAPVVVSILRDINALNQLPVFQQVIHWHELQRSP